SDVRAEIASLLNGSTGSDGAAATSGAMNGMQRPSRPVETQAHAPKAGKAPAKSTGAGAKSKAKKR
ncbi:MAG TPA: hypothetical protein VK516_01300, partial [Gemmatimonadaceae bacterium]|nr:hypothetical protein [Gemmatimonadaceae bacterium]